MSTRRLARVAVTAALVGAAAVAAPAVASAAVPVGGGTPITLGGVARCTLTAAGTDAAGRMVAFTAAHCTSSVGEPVTVTGDDGAGVVGKVVARNEPLDYAVIELVAGRAFPVRQAGIAGTGPLPAAGEVVCKLGASTGQTCGITWQVFEDKSYNQACAGHGDSGGPMMRGDRLVGILNGGDLPPALGVAGSLAGSLGPCTDPVLTPIFLPAFGTSFDRIVADATERGWPGGGFRMA